MRNLRSKCTPCKLYPISPSIKLGFKNKLRKVSCLRWGVRPNLASIALSYSFESYCPGLCRRRRYKQSHIEQQSILIRLTIRYLKQNSTPHFKLGTDILFALYMCVCVCCMLYTCAYSIYSRFFTVLSSANRHDAFRIHHTYSFD